MYNIKAKINLHLPHFASTSARRCFEKRNFLRLVGSASMYDSVERALCRYDTVEHLLCRYDTVDKLHCRYDTVHRTRRYVNSAESVEGGDVSCERSSHFHLRP